MAAPRILITGSNGMLGSALVEKWSGIYDLSGCGLRENRHAHLNYVQADITKPDQVRSVLDSLKPGIVVHAAAYTDVDGCEQNSEKAFSVNAVGTNNVARMVRETAAFLIYLSSDYVFSGTKGNPYLETDEPDPVSVYGKSKRAGELALQQTLAPDSYLIVRTSWIYGPYGQNFVESVLRLSRTEKELRLPADHEGAPTYTMDLSDVLAEIIQKRVHREMFVNGVLNVTNSGVTTWYEFAREILRLAGSAVPVRPISSSASNRPAKRPSYSVLDTGRLEQLIGFRLRPWKEALNEYMERRKT